MSKPDWSEWRHTPSVLEWQAVALSLDIEPHPRAIKQSQHSWMAGPGHSPIFLDESFPSKKIKKEFDKRLRMLSANLADRDFFSPELISGKGAGFRNVKLSEFAAWASSPSMQWDIPKELAALARKVTPHEARDESMNSGTDLKLGQNLPQDSGDKKDCITRNKVIGCFRVKVDDNENHKFWDDKLSRPPEWLKDALAVRGKRGESSLWNPITLAHCLLERKSMTMKQLNSVVHKHFPELEENWVKETPDQR